MPLPLIKDLLKSLPKREAKLPDDYYDTRATIARDLAFTVSGVARLDAMQRVLDSLDRNIQAGGSFTAWKKEAVANEVFADLPKYRKELVFRNHAGTAFMAGKCRNEKEVKSSRPYAMYSSTGDNRTRPAHKRWNKTVLPVDHPWWRTHTPLNGHNCRCDKILLTARQANKLGITEESDIDWSEPDEGWEYSPCENRTQGEVRALENKIESGYYHESFKPVAESLIESYAVISQLIQDAADE